LSAPVRTVVADQATIKRNGGPIDAYYLRGALKGVVAQDGSRRRENARGPNRDRHYYTRADFEEAWARYISCDPGNDPAHAAHPAPEPEAPGAAPGSVAPDQNEASGATDATPREDAAGAGLAPDHDTPSGATQGSDNSDEIGAGAVAPDAPDEIRPDANIHARCGYCGAALNGAACVAHDGKVFHADACLAEHLKRRSQA
jgi:hypothetical protein